MTATQDLLQTRDVYVAFAFAAADVLVEVDGEGKVAFAVGAAMALLGQPARKITGLTLADLLPLTDRPILDQALKRMRKGERVRNAVFGVVKEDGSMGRVSMSGYRHPDRSHHCLIALTFAPRPVSGDAVRQVPSRLHDSDSFRKVAERLMETGGSGDESYHMTLLDLPQVEAIRKQAGAAAAETFQTRLGDYLRACSVGGDAAGQLADDRFGVVHDASLDASVIEQAVHDLAVEAAPTAKLERPKSTTLVLDIADVSSAEAARALAYTLNAFTKEGGELKGDLSAMLQPRLSETMRDMAALRTLIESRNFELMFQPIVDLWTNVVHHFECLLRFEGGVSPYDKVVLAEDLGLIGKLDVGIADMAIRSLGSGPGAHPAIRYAVNLSGRSLSEPETIQSLRELMAKAKSLKGRLSFELTESAEIRNLAAVSAVLQEIREMGFEVSLDDFGAGNAAFHYLRALKVDHVKIDGSYVKDCMVNGENVAFIKSIVQLCSELGISTIAEYVENADTANLLKLLKVRYGQGYYFGKPSRPGPHKPGEVEAAWTSPSLEWRRGLLYFRG